MNSAIAKGFLTHGWICATKPMEIFFCFITGTTAVMTSINWSKFALEDKVPEEYPWIDATFINIIGCIIILHKISQFRTIYRLGSNYILGIAAIVTLMSTLVFCLAAIHYLGCSFVDLKDALVFLYLALDLGKVSHLAQYAMEASTYSEAQKNIVEGISIIGPTFTLDSTVTALVISAGTFSGGLRVEQLCRFGVLSAIVNYIIYMTFFLPCLSYVLELSSRTNSKIPPWILPKHVKPVETTKANPILQHVKQLMSGGLFLVHGIRSLTANNSAIEAAAQQLPIESADSIYMSSAIHAVFMVTVITLLIKYIVYESPDPLDEQPPMMAQRNPETRTIYTQTTESFMGSDSTSQPPPPRPIEYCMELLESQDGPQQLWDDEIVLLTEAGHLHPRNLELKLKDCTRAVKIRRRVLSAKAEDPNAMCELPYENYNYSKVKGTCCENVIGYMPIPLGMAGPLKVDGKEYMIPLATTEGALIASTSRGCKALNQCTSGMGVQTNLIKDGMTRAAVVELPSAKRAAQLDEWLKEPRNFVIIKGAFDATSQYAQLRDIHVAITGKLVFIRLAASTGDAMGMNMVAKGTKAALEILKKIFLDMDILSISGNMCTDKKPSAINWILGRGKSIVCEAIIPGDVVKKILKVDVAKLVDTNLKKNFVGSAMAGSIGGNNAHAANNIAALFLACGQDAAQVVASSACMTWMERHGENGDDLLISVSMPSLEVGTVGGGTNLGPQAACLKLLGLQGSSLETPGDNASRLASIAAATVMAGELSLMASLTEQTLVSSHLALNRPKC